MIRSLVKLGIMEFSSLLFRDKGSKVLYYHDVYKTINYKALDADVRMGTPYDLFRKHIDIIRSEGFAIVPAITKPEGEVAIMFDDGFRGVWECRDFFYQNKIFPTIFLPIEYIGRTDVGMLSIEEILELQAHGFIFECHGWSHRPLIEFDDNELKHELIDSRRELSKILNKNITSVCLPLGFFSPHLINKIQEAGYEKIFSCIPGNSSYRPWGLETRNLCQFASPKELQLILRGGNNLFKKRYQKLHCYD